MRRVAVLLHTNRKTVARRLCFLANEARLKERDSIREALQDSNRVPRVVFDEMESSHHTKLKPLSIALAVSESRVILGFEVCVMPAKGLLASLSRKKYGKRCDQRALALNRLFERVGEFLAPDVALASDECPRYPRLVKKHFPKSSHIAHKGKRGCVVGQGELKKIGFDPLFSLNHTAAMFRANVNRLFRRTWCTTKRVDRLRDHLSLYMAWHNRELGRALARKRFLTPLPLAA
jgi:hypothetical protein